MSRPIECCVYLSLKALHKFTLATPNQFIYERNIFYNQRHAATSTSYFYFKTRIKIFFVVCYTVIYSVHAGLNDIMRNSSFMSWLLCLPSNKLIRYRIFYVTTYSFDSSHFMSILSHAKQKLISLNVVINAWK